MKLSVLHRYILLEFLPPFGVGLLVFTFLLVLHHLFLMMDLFLNRGVDLFIIFKMAILVLPIFLPLSLPMASLLGALVSYGRLSEEGELTALRSAGCHLMQYSLPNILFGLLITILLVYFNLDIAPRATLAFKDIHYAVVQKSPLALFSPKVMNHFGEYKVIVDTMDRKKRKLHGISIYKMNPDGAPTRILAPEGEVSSYPDGDLTLELNNGTIHQPSSNKENEYTITRFNRFSLRIPAKMDIAPRSISAREMTVGELQTKIEESESENFDPSPLRTEKHLRIAIAFSPLIFVFLGTVLGIELKKGSKAVGFGMSIFVILVYYGLLVFAISLSANGMFSPFVLTWCPNFVIMLAGLFFWYRLTKR